MRSAPIVLVVEDNTELRNVLKETLSAEGYAVLTARDETEALETLRENSVDLFISDLTGPTDSGRTVQAVKDEFPNIPIVAMAATGGLHPALFFSAWGGDRMHRTLSQPFRLGELLAVSREVLGAQGSEAR